MAIPELEGFNLAGGTALALQIGHRLSVDLDFFGNRPFDAGEVQEFVSEAGNTKIIHRTKNILVLNVEDIKVDFVNYKYPLLEEVHLEEKIRLLSLPDIGAMKLAAITGRGRKRDFTDLYFLMQIYPLPDLIRFYNTKYADGNDWMVVRSLTYFDDADEDEDLTLFKKADWNIVKKTIEEEVKIFFS